jgi:hypothetical protein
MRFFLLLSTLLHVSLLGIAQVRLSDTPEKEIYYGRGGKELIRDLIETEQGQIAAVGTVSNGHNGNQDILFMLLNDELEVLKAREIGRQKNDGAYKVRRRPDGGFLLIGYSETPESHQSQYQKYFGKTDGWMLWLNAQGETESEFIYGTNEDDHFRQAIPLPDGGYLLAGQSNRNAWVIRLAATGEILWDKRWQYQKKVTTIHSAVLIRDGQLIVGGSLLDENGYQPWVAGLSMDGQLLFQKQYDQLKEGMIHDLVEIDATTIAVAGEAELSDKRKDGFFARINLQGQIQDIQTFGGRENDQLFHISRGVDGGFLLSGKSYSFERGARRSKAWMVALDKKGREKDQAYYGSKLDDEGLASLQLNNRNWIACGSSRKKSLLSDQGWFFSLRDRKEENDQADPVKVRFVSAYYPSETVAHPQRPYLLYKLSTQRSGLHQLRALIFNTANAPIDTIQLGIQPPDSRELISIPLEDVLTSEEKAESIRFYAGDKALTDRLSINLKMPQKKPKEPELSISLAAATLTDDHFPLQIQNKGDKVARQTSLAIIAQECFPAPITIPLGDLPPGASLTYQLSSHLLAACRQNAAEVTLRIADEELLYTSSMALEWSSFSHTVSPASDIEKENMLVATWITPNPDLYDHSEINWPTSQMTLRIKAISSEEIKREHFCLIFNDRTCQDGVKMEEVSMKGSKNSKTFEVKVQLEEGLNILQAVVDNQTTSSKTEPLKILYTPSKPNLHVLSIGVPSTDLKYTVQDARDMARLFQQTASSNQAYGHIFIDSLVRENQTTKTAILKNLRKLIYRYKDQQISEQDVLLIFISSHGLSSDEGKFRIAASDFDSPFQKETSLDFEQEIIRYLKEINCRKLFLIDACHSGGAAGSLYNEQTTANSLIQLADRFTGGINLLMSCQANEYSYEDDKWQNGAFTESILEVFSGFMERPEEYDLNSDQQLDVSELFHSINQEVPRLVKKKKPNTQTDQTPLLIAPPEIQKTILIALPKN